MAIDFSFRRTNRTFWGEWLWTIDLLAMLVVGLLLGIGVLLMMAASPSVAAQYHYPTFFFVKRHLLFALCGLALLIASSHMTLDGVRRTSVLLCLFLLSLLWMTVVFGASVKGARRWLDFGGFKLQPSELVRPCMIVMSAWFLSEQKRLNDDFPGLACACVLHGLVLAALVLQPDVGTGILIVGIFFIQLFLFGLSWHFVGILAGLCTLSGGFLYALLPHVRERISLFFGADKGDPFGGQFQILKSVQCLEHGGLWGVGPGEGTIKRCLPDAHTDFIFSVAGEEFGLIFCLFLVIVYGSLILRHFLWIARGERSLFMVLAIVGLVSNLGLAALVNMASALNLIPTKGMPLPFISYGGSAMLGACLTMGFLMALTRKRLPDSRF